MGKIKACKSEEPMVHLVKRLTVLLVFTMLFNGNEVNCNFKAVLYIFLYSTFQATSSSQMETKLSLLIAVSGILLAAPGSQAKVSK